jgi:hypothetical protein
MLKYGVENFKFEMLIICFDEDVVKFEKEYIKKFNSIQPNGYNILSGGQIGDGHVGFKHRPKTIEKIKEAGRKFREQNPNHYDTIRDKIKEARKGINYSERIKNSEKFKKAMEERREKYKKGMIKVSDETKEKLRQSAKKYYQTHTSSARSFGQERRRKHMEGINRTISKPVLQYTPEGTFVKEYISIAEAMRISGVKANNISRILSKNRGLAGGYSWKYKHPQAEYPTT